MNLLFPEPEALQLLRRLPALAVDLGFGASKSCGLAFHPAAPGESADCVSFGRCVERVAQFVSDHPDCVLIVEAPLSGLFNSNGDPARRAFEVQSKNGKLETRAWYVQAGATMALAAVLLFSKLSSRVPPSHNVHVLEGFLTFKPEKSDQSRDAQDLLDALQGTVPFSPFVVSSAENSPVTNLLAMARLAPADSRCPLVLAVQRS